MPRPIAILALVLFAACDSAHPATPTVQRFLDALQYGDHAGLLAAHIDGTSQSEWCRPEFKKLLTRAQAETHSEDCQRVRSLTTSDLAAMKDELRLAVQVTGWSCEHPKGSCIDYASTVFEQALADHPLIREKPTASKIRRIFGDESTAAAYVDITHPDGSVEHRTLELKHVGEGWRISKGFLTP